MQNLIIIKNFLRLTNYHGPFLILVLIVFSSIFEIALLSSIFPVILLITKIDSGINFYFYDMMNSYLGIKNLNENNYFLIVILSFCTFVVIASLLRVLTLFVSTKYSFLLAEEVRNTAFSRAMQKDYVFYNEQNSTDYVLLLTEKSGILGQVFTELFTLVNSIVISLAIFITLIFFSPLLSSFILLFGFLYTLLVLLVRKRLNSNSHRQAEATKKLARSVKDSIIGYRDVLVNGLQSKMIKLVTNANREEMQAYRENWVIARVPRYLMEGVSIVLISCMLGMFILFNAEKDAILPMFAVLALGSQRVLPLLQQAFHAYSFISANSANIKEVHFALGDDTSTLPKTSENTVVENFFLSPQIELHDVSYSHNNSPGRKPIKVFTDFSTKFYRGKMHALVGPSGSGKSTIIDLVCGVIQPESGNLSVNGKNIHFGSMKAWQSKIGLVSQDVILVDDTIFANLTYFADTHVDNEFLLKCCELSCFIEDIHTFQDGFNQRIGEGGKLLSGGQKQRLGIARALYTNPALLVLDEATNGVSVNMEKTILLNIKNNLPDVTVISVTHREENLPIYDQINKLKIVAD